MRVFVVVLAKEQTEGCWEPCWVVYTSLLSSTSCFTSRCHCSTLKIIFDIHYVAPFFLLVSFMCIQCKRTENNLLFYSPFDYFSIFSPFQLVIVSDPMVTIIVCSKWFIDNYMWVNRTIENDSFEFLFSSPETRQSKIKITKRKKQMRWQLFLFELRQVNTNRIGNSIHKQNISRSNNVRLILRL